MKVRISLFHKCGYGKWQELVYAQVVCRAIRRITGRHWQNSNKKYRRVYELHQQQLSDLNRIDRQELNNFIERNNKDFDGHKIRNLINAA